MRTGTIAWSCKSANQITRPPPRAPRKADAAASDPQGRQQRRQRDQVGHVVLEDADEVLRVAGPDEGVVGRGDVRAGDVAAGELICTELAEGRLTSIIQQRETPHEP